MRRLFPFAVLLAVLRCASAPPPSAPPATPPLAPAEETVIGTVRVTASALNVRSERSADAEVVTQVKKGETLSVLSADESWTRVKLAGGETGWVASRFVSSGAEKKATAHARKKGSCPADSDFAFAVTPVLTFSDSSAHGLVVVEASVNTSGAVTSTRVVSNNTGDDALGFLTQKEIKAAKFSPPIRNCVPRAFLFTYRRTF